VIGVTQGWETKRSRRLAFAFLFYFIFSFVPWMPSLTEAYMRMLLRSVL
jgi:hypothetical protein